MIFINGHHNYEQLTMEKKVTCLPERECFCVETDLDWAREETVWLDSCCLIVVKRGSARVMVGKNAYTVGRNQLLFMRSDLPWKVQETSSDFLVTLIGFPISMLHEGIQRMEPDFLLLLFSKLVWDLNAQARRMLSHFCELFRFAVSDYGSGYSRELVMLLVTGCIYGVYKVCGQACQERSPSDSSRSRELFRRFMELLHENFSKQHEVQFYANCLCISAKYLTQISKRVIGRTPKQIIDDRLLHEAMKMLDMNNSSIQDISVRLGFPDQSYFGRFFKRMKQVSPQQYRVKPIR